MAGNPKHVMWHVLGIYSNALGFEAKPASLLQLPAYPKERKAADKFKPLFSTYLQQNGKRYFRPQKQNFSINNASPFKETAGLQLCLHCAHGAVKHPRGRSPWAPAGLSHAPCAQTVPPARDVPNSALPSSFQNKTGG